MIDIVLGAPTTTAITLSTGGSHVLPARTGQFSVQCRTAADIKLNSNSTFTTHYVTIKSGTSYNSPVALFADQTLYFSGTDALVVEVITWPIR